MLNLATLFRLLIESISLGLSNDLGRDGVSGRKERGRVEPLLAVVSPLPIFSLHHYFQERPYIDVWRQEETSLEVFCFTDLI